MGDRAMRVARLGRSKRPINDNDPLPMTWERRAALRAMGRDPDATLRPSPPPGRGGGLLFLLLGILIGIGGVPVARLLTSLFGRVTGALPQPPVF